ncbi:beta-1,6-N-acetylglucosaminyltransferase [Methylomonas sp. MgM2]
MEGFVYLIFSHGEPTQVVRLVRAIRSLSPDSAIVIHHDKSSEPLDSILFGNINNLYIIEDRVRVRWGDISFVDAILSSLKWVTDNLDYTWVITISGADYPISRLRDFENHLISQKTDGAFRYFEAFSHPGWPPGQGKKRYLYNYFSLPDIPYHRVPESIRKVISVFVTNINKQGLFKIKPKYRSLNTAIGLRKLHTPFSQNFKCYAGWDWLNLSKKAVTELLDFVALNPEIKYFYKNSILPSESMIHTILINNDSLKFENESYRFIKWFGKNDASPKNFESEDMDLLIESSMPFARKFDMHFDADVLDKLDSYLGIES